MLGFPFFQSPPPAVLQGHTHAEAFNLMYYEHVATGVGFPVYNPRDGVTPLCCIIEGQVYQHHHVHLDRFLPGLTMPAGLRYFRDRTPEEAAELAEQRLAQFDGTALAVPAEERPQALASLVAEFLRTPKLDRVPPAPNL